MCRRVWLVALLTTALSCASAVMNVRTTGWGAGAALSLLTALASAVVVVITYRRRHLHDCGPIIDCEAVELGEDA